MPAYTVNKQINYALINTSLSYYLTIVIGNGQSGSTTFRNAQGKKFNPDVENCLVGTGVAINGKTFLAVSTVSQVNPSSLTLLVTYYISTAPLDLDNLDNITPAGSSEVTAGANETYTFETQLKFS